jgi:hypothetical protein
MARESNKVKRMGASMARVSNKAKRMGGRLYGKGEQ